MVPVHGFLTAVIVLIFMSLPDHETKTKGKRVFSSKIYHCVNYCQHNNISMRFLLSFDP